MATDNEMYFPSVADLDREIARLSQVGVAGHFPFAVDAVNGWMWARKMKARIDELTAAQSQPADA